LNHYTWTYIGGAGRNYRVGLFHGSKTGHVLIYVGAKIVTLDFKVFDSKVYTFFIDDELCNIRLERRGDKMFYFFEIDQKTDTPRNRARKIMEHRYLWQALTAFGIFTLVVAGFAWWMSHSSEAGLRSKTEELLARQGRETVGMVAITSYPTRAEVTYHFVAGNEGFTSSSTPASRPIVLLESGMPLESGDEFVVIYAQEHPEINRIYFNRPTEKQLARYQRRAAGKYAQLHPDEAPSIIACMVNAAFQLNGVGGLADFYFQDVPAGENPGHNEITYLRLTRDLPFQKMVEKECR
jgi:hypothetical protein